MFVLKVDVIIAVHNAETTIEETVQSAMHQEIPDHLIHQLSPDDGDISSTKSSRTCNIHFDVCVCCYNDASTDQSLEKLHSMVKESTSCTTADNGACRVTMQTKLLIGTAPAGTSSRGAGYARNQAAKLRDNYEKNGNESTQGDPSERECAHYFLCILDSDDIMHPTRIAEQTCAMLSLGDDEREKTLMGCKFDRIPKDSTQHYTQWANSLSDERLYLEQFRECTLLQPTWFLAKAWFDRIGGYLEAPVPGIDETNPQKRAKIELDKDVSDDRKSPVLKDAEYTNDSDLSSKQFYRLFHPSEIALDSTIHKDATSRDKRKISPPQEKSVNSLRLAEDSRFFYAHLHAGGRLHLHRTSSPLVTYRHRSGMSQSSNTPRKLLLKLRAKAWEDLVFSRQANDSSNSRKWTDGFAIWGAGRDGKDFLKALSPATVSKVVCFVDVDQKKIEQIQWYDNPALGGIRIPILHFSVLAKNDVTDQVTHGHIDKKQRGEESFNIVQSNPAGTNEQNNGSKQISVSKAATKQRRKKANESVDPEVLQQLPVAICVAMYRTNGALESNVASIGRVEGQDLWHIM